jgi:hypothetical protein
VNRFVPRDYVHDDKYDVDAFNDGALYGDYEDLEKGTKVNGKSRISPSPSSSPSSPSFRLLLSLLLLLLPLLLPFSPSKLVAPDKKSATKSTEDGQEDVAGANDDPMDVVEDEDGAGAKKSTGSASDEKLKNLEKKRKLKEAFNKEYDTAKQSGKEVDQEEAKFFEERKSELHEQQARNKAVCTQNFKRKIQRTGDFFLRRILFF